MKYLKLFEEMEIKDFPFEGNDLSPRESKILIDLVGQYYLNHFKIKVEDHFYYTKYGSDLNIFNDLWELRDYLLFRYYMYKGRQEGPGILKLLNISKIDPSFDNNRLIEWASYNGRIEIVKFLLNDPRVRSKLSEWEINKYTYEIS